LSGQVVTAANIKVALDFSESSCGTEPNGFYLAEAYYEQAGD